MAITATLCELLRGLQIKPGSTLLEIGQANWYGDISPESVGLKSQESLFAIVREFYSDWFAPERIDSVDLNGSDNAKRLDLNQPFYLEQQYGVVINHGTAEHVFNIAQVFATMHAHCDINGWLIHDAPFTGWVDHGFYCLQPGLFYDLAHANCYEVHTVAIHECKSRQIVRVQSRGHIAKITESGGFPHNSSLFVALRKRVERPFAIPLQGYYARTLDADSKNAWERRT